MCWNTIPAQQLPRTEVLVSVQFFFFFFTCLFPVYVIQCCLYHAHAPIIIIPIVAAWFGQVAPNELYIHMYHCTQDNSSVKITC